MAFVLFFFFLCTDRSPISHARAQQHDDIDDGDDDVDGDEPPLQAVCGRAIISLSD
jgi:hypothetical protein